MGVARGPQTGAEIAAQTEVGVAGRVYWDTAPVRRCQRSRDGLLKLASRAPSRSLSLSLTLPVLQTRGYAVGLNPSRGRGAELRDGAEL